MKKFSDLGITVQEERKIFECKQLSINEIVNCEITVKDYIPDVKTKHGENRYLIEFEMNNETGKFFTNCKNIKITLDAIPKEEFPFTTKIKCTKIGNNSIYKFT